MIMTSEAPGKAGGPGPQILITAPQIEARVAELGRQIREDYRDAPSLRLIGMLRGACFFVADLARAIERDVSLDFMRVRSYGAGTENSGEIAVTKDIEEDIAGLDVLIVEDIIDSGRTASCVLQLLERRKPRSLKLAALLSKPSRRVVEIEPDYLGFEIPDQFVVGYGLDLAERYRNLREIRVLESGAFNSVAQQHTTGPRP
jgi:hypoxanthine phosphoribosyltransferase